MYSFLVFFRISFCQFRCRWILALRMVFVGIIMQVDVWVILIVHHTYIQTQTVLILHCRSTLSSNYRCHYLFCGWSLASWSKMHFYYKPMVGIWLAMNDWCSRLFDLWVSINCPNVVCAERHQSCVAWAAIFCARNIGGF